VFALYERSFWREEGLSGTAQSMVGPLVEIHDATTASGQAALFGFVGVPAAQRKTMGQDALITASLRQLITLFGPDAGTPQATLYKDWAADPLTATDWDWGDGAHPLADGRAWVDGAWHGRITLAGSETSATEPGYLAGAVHAAERAVADVTRRLGSR
jgi:monoamine oxidase